MPTADSLALTGCKYAPLPPKAHLQSGSPDARALMGAILEAVEERAARKEGPAQRLGELNLSAVARFRPMLEGEPVCTLPYLSA